MVAMEAMVGFARDPEQTPFTASLLLRATTQAHEIERGVAHRGHFFVPLFFVTVGAAVDVSMLNLLEPGN